MKWVSLVLPGFIFCCRVWADPLHSPDANLLAHWIAGQQYHHADLRSYGAIRSEEGVAATGTNGSQYYSVSPYSANLAVIGMLQSKAPDGVHVAGLWIDWYFHHLNIESAPEGVPDNHFYLRNGLGETTCVKPGDPALCDYNDATDSAAATFFSVLWAAHQAGMPAAVLNTTVRKHQVERLADVLLKLQQPDGLCWAKSNYHVKYLEDNSEVYAGLGALADLEENVFDDPQRSTSYRNAASRVQKGILKELYDPQAHLFRIAKFENSACPSPNLDTWYPDTQAQLWPLLFGVITPDSPQARAVASAVNTHWNGKTKPDWPANPERVNQGWIEAGHAYAALLMGDTNRVQVYAMAVKRYKFQAPGKTPQFTWPFSVDDAGWLLRIFASPQANDLSGY